MLLCVFLLMLTLTVYFTNAKNGSGAQASEQTLEFNRLDSIIILLCMASTIPINWVLKNFLPDYYWIGVIISSAFLLMILIVVNMHREDMIKKRHDQILNVFRALSDIFGKVNPENIDFDSLPFALEEDDKNGTISKITIDMSLPDGKFNDNTITLAQYSINKHFPDLQWVSVVDHPKRELVFKGLPKPPYVAKYPGSDYRPTGWIPLGLSGSGEIGWNISDPKKDEMGTSSYVDEDGHIPDAVDMPSAPQCLVLGSTGGGKAIFVHQMVEVMDN